MPNNVVLHVSIGGSPAGQLEIELEDDSLPRTCEFHSQEELGDQHENKIYTFFLHNRSCHATPLRFSPASKAQILEVFAPREVTTDAGFIA